MNDPRSKNHRSVESHESRQGQDIVVDEHSLPSPAAAIHERIRQEGQKELVRDGRALLWSAIAAGLSMGTSLIAMGLLHAELKGVTGAHLLESFGYTLGFIIVIMARQQLFTENTVTAVLPIMHQPSMHNFRLLLRLWGIVLFGNLIGTALAALGYTALPVFSAEVRHAFSDIALHVMENPPEEMFANAMVSGWIIATMVWMLPNAGNAKILVIIIMTWLISASSLTHIVAGATEIFYLVFNQQLSWQAFIWPFALPTLAGNIIGGTFVFALISHAQIRSDLPGKDKKAVKLNDEKDELSR
ncbi:hypothetical protein AU509_00575 [Lonsdalea britannica]|uniref:Formate transporter n=1 Tax=Lonsdalea britannica TaxID=1082704 RepID=A0AAD0WM49_9GAMM|nr:formate/nitrite transporter family protein [Lonsdalea britannica]AXW88507.1 hypothetical protein CKQ53_17000 [Lonsdalea britannica]OSN00554.1 hypothetical protein AU509_00575 [Lonsdalea britannica]